PGSDREFVPIFPWWDWAGLPRVTIALGLTEVVIWQRRTQAVSGRPPGAPKRPRRPRPGVPRRSGSGRRSSPTTWTPSWTRSTKCSRRTPRSSSGRTCRRAASSPDGRGARRFTVGGRAGASRVLSRSGVAVGSDEYARYDYGRRSALGSYFDGSQPGPFGGGPRASGR